MYAIRSYYVPITPLFFALVGLPLGIQTTRSGRGGGFALSYNFV